MAQLPRALCGLGLIAALAVLAVLAQPAPRPARANPLCDVGSGPAGAVTGGIGAITGGAIGGGNPVGDACNQVTDGAVGAVTNPVTGAIEGLGNSIFAQITSWASEGTAWLIGRVVEVVEETTTPKLTSEGFLSEYSQMAVIGALLTAAMLLLAVLEGVARGDMGMLVRVVGVNLPLAFIATSVAYVVVQMLLVGTDGLCHAVGQASQHRGEHFFKGAIAGLGEAGGSVGEAAGEVGPQGAAAGKAGGEVAAPLFVAFLAAAIGGFAAFFVWVELLMRDAAVYVVSLFMPLALASSIWPRWSGAMRRTGELIVVVIGSKFVIVSIIALAAGLVSSDSGGVEHVLAATALMLLACFSPFALFRLVPFAEGAMSAAYSRRHAGASTMGGARSIGSSAQVMRRTASASWGRGASGRSGAGSAGGMGRLGSRGAKGAGGTAAAKGGAQGGAIAGAGAGAGAAAAGSLPLVAAKGARAGAERLAQSEVGQSAAAQPGKAAGSEVRSKQQAAQPERDKPEKSSGSKSQPNSPTAGASPARPPGDSAASPGEARGGSVPDSGGKPARPTPEMPKDGGGRGEKR
jgi:type IV secretion system protein TrbL